MFGIKENAKTFSTRMFILAAITGLLISLCTPLTYLCLGWKAKQADTAALAQQIAHEILEIIIINPPNSSQGELLQMKKLLATYQQKQDIKHVKIITSCSNLESQSAIFMPALFDISHRTDIAFHGKNYGYVEVTTTAANVIMSTLLLTGIFFGLGLLTNTLLYRLPVDIVSENEKNLKNMADELKKSTAELTYVKSLLEQTTLVDSKTTHYDSVYSNEPPDK
ncbi:hypothetical protein SCACP_10640 [Sporomusa carbonis]|uniref:hypothetical protein n=1 Tax=Sporomusa carbonis TaxID=3076075 RepID=UPI003A6C2139